MILLIMRWELDYGLLIEIVDGTIVVKIVCANELWIRSMNVVNMRCQARIAGLVAEIGLSIMADHRQMLATAWRP